MPERRQPERRAAGGACVFVVGAASLGVEIAVARLLAPYFGASTIVWANTIAVVLVALSVGYWFGGRLADRHPHLRGLCLLVLGAAVLIAVVPFAARPFLGFSVDAFDTVSVGGFAGSLFGVLVLVAVPVTLLGAAAPWAVRLAVDEVARLGRGGRPPLRDLDRRLAGRDDGLGAAPDPAARHPAHLPRLRRGARPGRLAGGRAAAGGRGAGGAGAGALAVPAGTIKGAGDGRVLYEAETTQQYARVVERDDGSRALELNEGQAVHSLYRPGQLPDRRLLGRPPGAAGARRGGRPPRRIAILGNAGGTVARAYGHYFPRDRGRRGRDRRRADRARPPLPRPAQPADGGLRRGRAALARALRAAATTRSWSTPTASPTSPSTWRPASSSSWPASGWRRAGW